MRYMIYTEGDDAFVTAFVPGAPRPLTASTASHPNFAEIVQGLKADDPGVYRLFDLAETVSDRFEDLSERVAVRGGHVYFDGDRVDNSLTRQIIRFLEEGHDDWVPLVRFMENVAANPSERSREQLYEWLNRRDFTITDSGDIVGYKGVRASSRPGVSYESISSGPGIVDGVNHNGHLPNDPGSTVSVARSYVTDDASIGCHKGLHVGSYDYAKSFGPVVLECHVNPRDVVSVPTECDAAKVRCCRYEVVGVVTQEYDSAYAADESDEDEYYDED